MKTKFTAILIIVAGLTLANFAQTNTYPSFKTAMDAGKAFDKARDFDNSIKAYSAAKDLAKTDIEKADALFAEGTAWENVKIFFASQGRKRSKIGDLDKARNTYLEITILPNASDDIKIKAYKAIVETHRKEENKYSANLKINDIYTQILKLKNVPPGIKADIYSETANVTGLYALADAAGVSDEIKERVLMVLANQAYGTNNKVPLYERVVNLPNASTYNKTLAIFSAASLLGKDKKYAEYRTIFNKLFVIKDAKIEDKIKAHRSIAESFLAENNRPSAVVELAKIEKLPNLTNDQKADAYVENGSLYFNYKIYDSARSEYNKVHKLKNVAEKFPATAYLYTGNSYAQQVNYAKAREEWEKVLKTKANPEMLSFKMSALDNIGKTFYTEKNYAEASKAFEKYTKLQGLTPKQMSVAQFLLGSSYLAENKYQPARTEFNKVLESENATIADRINAGKNIVKSFEGEKNADGVASTYVKLIPIVGQNPYTLQLSNNDKSAISKMMGEVRADTLKTAENYAQDAKTQNAALTIYQGFVDYTKQSKRDPQAQVKAYIGIGDIYVSQNKLAEAKTAYENGLAVGIPATKSTLDAKISEVNSKLQAKNK